MPPSAAVIKERLSERYGWLPSEIENEDCRIIDDYIEIINAKEQLAKYHAKKYGRN